MPNWVKTNAIIYGNHQDIAKIERIVRTAENNCKLGVEADWTKGLFQQFCSMPAELRDVIHDSYVIQIDDGCTVDRVLSKISFDFLKTGCQTEEYSEVIANIKKAFAMKSKYGYVSWHSWAWSNWGTKWDASDVCINGIENGDNPNISFSFQTAWDFPEEAMLAFSRIFPDCVMSFEYADEDIESGNWGEMEIEEGSKTSENHRFYPAVVYEDIDYDRSAQIWGWEDYEDWKTAVES